MYTTCTLHVHYMYTTCTLHVHYQNQYIIEALITKSRCRALDQLSTDIAFVIGLYVLMNMYY